MANAPVYFVNAQEIRYGLHLHYIYYLPTTRFGLGLGYEHIFDEHQHNTIGIVGSYRTTDRLSFNVSPGITFEGSETDHLNFALHLETLYEFALGDFHWGPVLEFAYDPEDYHIRPGLHIGFGF